LKKSVIICILILMVPIVPVYARQPIRVDRKAILQIKALPYYPEWTTGDKQYWDIVRKGKDSFDDLAALVNDPSDTHISVPLIGGTYAVGDIALLALMDIVHGLPVLSMIQTICPNDKNNMDIGFGQYWNFVRKNRTNHSKLQKSIQKWLKKNSSSLVWVEKRGHPAKGWWTIQKNNISTVIAKDQK